MCGRATLQCRLSAKLRLCTSELTQCCGCLEILPHGDPAACPVLPSTGTAHTHRPRASIYFSELLSFQDLHNTVRRLLWLTISPCPAVDLLNFPSLTARSRLPFSQNSMMILQPIEDRHMHHIHSKETWHALCLTLTLFDTSWRPLQGLQGCNCKQLVGTHHWCVTQQSIQSNTD